MAHDITKDVIGCRELEIQKVNISGEPAEFLGSMTLNDHIITKGYVDTLTTNHPHQDVNTTASPTFDEITLSLGVNDDYKILRGAHNSHALAIQNQVSGAVNRVGLFTKDGDGTDPNFFRIFGVGTVAAGGHSLLSGWLNTGRYAIIGGNGVGFAGDFSIQNTDIHTEQILLKTDGSVEFNDGEVAFAHEINTKNIQTVGLIYASGNIEGANLTTRSALNLKGLGGVINWDEGDITLTHSTNGLTFLGMNTFDLGNSDLEMGGDLIFVGNGSGVSYGCVEGTDETITCTTQNTWYQVTFDTIGVNNNTTPSAAQNHITINETGDYQTNVIACLHTANAQDIEILVKKENGTVDLGIHLYQTTGVAGKVENTAGGCLLPIDATDTMELWVRCTSAGTVDVIFDHVSLSCSQVGGQ